MTEQRKLAAVMFTDIAGYTAIMSRNELKALAILEKNRTLQKSLAGKHKGEFLKEMGAPRIEPIDVLKITKSNLPQETQVVVLNYR